MYKIYCEKEKLKKKRRKCGMLLRKIKLFKQMIKIETETIKCNCRKNTDGTLISIIYCMFVARNVHADGGIKEIESNCTI